ncbi:hypothetical protein BH24ACT5_BH24ACT5_15270 [soil metagenome]
MRSARPAVLFTFLVAVLTGAGVAVGATSEPPVTTITSDVPDGSDGEAAVTSEAVPAPDLADIELSGTGLGVVEIGDDAESTIATMERYLGDPTSDTQWVDPLTLGVCTGAAARLVSWGSLRLYFVSDDPVDAVETVETVGRGDSSVPAGTELVPAISPATSRPTSVAEPTGSVETAPGTTVPAGTGPRLAGFVYGEVSALDANPPGLSTPEGIGLGALVEFLQAAYPDVIVESGIEGIAAATFFVDEGLRGYVTGVEADDLVTTIIGGEVCDS